MSTFLSKEFNYRQPLASVEAIKNALVYKMIFMLGCDPREARPQNWMSAAQYVVRDLLAENWLQTRREQFDEKQRFVYYLSMEYLMGRTLSNALIASQVYDLMREAFAGLDLDFDQIITEELDPGLGNGGLGRLAACFLDSLATLKIPAVGYGIRYEYGMFRQEIVDGQQVEQPDTWLEQGTPWDFVRPSKRYRIRFGGHVIEEGGQKKWREAEEIVALGYDEIIPGYDNGYANTLRLWSTHASDIFNLASFNKGDYFAAIEKQNSSENLSRVLYPDDSTAIGRELRLKQEYFLCSASLQDILVRHLASYKTLDNLADKVAIHLNDTHPALAIPELLRLLIDEHGYAFKDAWSMAQAIFSYTNHTLMGEALETWPVDMLGYLLPRHLNLIFKMNKAFLEEVRQKFPDDEDLVRRVSLIEEHNGRNVRMAWVAVVGSHKINGVAKIHSQLMVQSIFADFARIFPERFTNVTNGVTPRRWMALANRGLSALIDEKIGRGWRKNLAELNALMQWQHDEAFQQALAEIKLENKRELAAYIEQSLGITVNPEALFDVQIKRIHEYKRQTMNVLHIIYRYQQILKDPEADWQPRVFLIAGKAASAYHTAKETIHLINDVAEVINNDLRIRDLIKVVFLPNYSVSLAQLIIPAADLSEQISLAGTEASGTSNMKFALNGALTIGTLDGATVEMREVIGDEHLFIFGHTVEEVSAIREQGYFPLDYLERDSELREVVKSINKGTFSPKEPGRYGHLIPAQGDYYQALADFRSYVDTQALVDQHYRDQSAWRASMVANIAQMGYFSSDRSIRDYADDIWHVTPQ
ncbi:glycogen/starch/alpha-glucan phosphorylase [Suttonella sp. R2A3]|uniref:glycogen/starch/alpha-glucan phosphorylase n=1 Tax=Suttonella sp. R2A3 TaxID=2908648 RepID=UPI001F1795DA|nr:glycogen/starch/alpha-glucan phosphorylase [Suttonella sp. R2A3]UJF24864.1 glycogen/starch/alpha-glucan phosphorylase [Suttonella sp. R2A3]